MPSRSLEDAKQGGEGVEPTSAGPPTPEDFSSEIHTEDVQRCGAIRKNDGKRCRFWGALCDATGRCPKHCQCPSHVEARKAHGRKGGTNTGINARARARWPLPGDPQNADDIKTLLVWAARRLNSDLAAKVSRLCDLWLKAHNQGNLAGRLAELEAQIASYQSSHHA